jgi:hypothetical protein
MTGVTSRAGPRPEPIHQRGRHRLAGLPRPPEAVGAADRQAGHGLVVVHTGVEVGQRDDLLQQSVVAPGPKASATARAAAARSSPARSPRQRAGRQRRRLRVVTERVEAASREVLVPPLGAAVPRLARGRAAAAGGGRCGAHVVPA